MQINDLKIASIKVTAGLKLTVPTRQYANYQPEAHVTLELEAGATKEEIIAAQRLAYELVQKEIVAQNKELKGLLGN